MFEVTRVEGVSSRHLAAMLRMSRKAYVLTRTLGSVRVPKGSLRKRLLLQPSRQWAVIVGGGQLTVIDE